MPCANIFPARDIALATPNAELRLLEAHKELQPCSRLTPTPLSGQLKAQPLTPCKQMGWKAVPAGSCGPGGSRVGVRLPHAPISAALKKLICNLYKALEIGVLWVHAKPRWPSAPLSLCFPPNPSLLTQSVLQSLPSQ